MAASDGAKTVHRGLDDARHPLVIGVHRLARLEISVRIMRRAADEGMFRVKRAGTMGAHQIVIDHRANIGIGQQVERVQLMRGPKAVEKMQEGDA